MEATDSSSEFDVSFVDKLNPDDVLVRRGPSPIDHEGNIRFKRIVDSLWKDYVDGKKEKDFIVHQIVGMVALRGGHFLRRIESSAEAEQMGVPKE